MEASRRLLWDYTSDDKTNTACKDVTFKSKPSTPVDSMMDTMMSQRKDDKPLKKFADDNKIQPYLMSLLGYFVPWAILFIFALIA